MSEICLNTMKLSDIQYARFQILPVDLYFGLFWSAGIPTMYTGVLQRFMSLWLNMTNVSIAGSPVLQLFLAISISFKSTFLVFLLCYLVTLVSDLCISDIILSLITLDGGFFAYCTPVDSPPLSTMQKQILKVTSPLSSYVAMTSMLILIM